jgi:hypothetical protein
MTAPMAVRPEFEAPSSLVLTARQESTTRKVRDKVGEDRVGEDRVGEDREVLLGAVVRRSLQMSPTAWVFVAVFIGGLVVGFYPGLLLLFVFREVINVSMYVGLTDRGMTVVKKSWINGAPREVAGHFVIGSVHLLSRGRRVQCGDSIYQFSRRDMDAVKALVGISYLGPSASATEDAAPTVGPAPRIVPMVDVAGLSSRRGGRVVPVGPNANDSPMTEAGRVVPSVQGAAGERADAPRDLGRVVPIAVPGNAPSVLLPRPRQPAPLSGKNQGLEDLGQ